MTTRKLTRATIWFRQNQITDARLKLRAFGPAIGLTHTAVWAALAETSDYDHAAVRRAIVAGLRSLGYNMTDKELWGETE